VLINSFTLSPWVILEMIVALFAWSAWIIGLMLRPLGRSVFGGLQAYQTIIVVSASIGSLLFLEHSGLIAREKTLWGLYMVISVLAPIALRFILRADGLKTQTVELAFWLISLANILGLLLEPSWYIRSSQPGFLRTTSGILGSVVGFMHILIVVWAILIRFKRYSSTVMQQKHVQPNSGELTKKKEVFAIAWFIFATTCLLEQLRIMGAVQIPPMFWIGSLTITVTYTWLVHLERSEAFQNVTNDVQNLKQASSNLETRMNERTKELNYRVMHDPLTGLANRTNADQSLTEMLEEAQASQRGVAVLLLDLDRFKDVNDTAGHPIGDQVLRTVSARFQACLPIDALLARLGGDEFLVFLPDLEPHEAAQIAECTASAISETINNVIRIGDLEFLLGVSIGISVYPENGSDATTLQTHADIAMYRAKREGSGYGLFTAGLDASVKRKIELEQAMRHALETNPDEVFHLMYQPLVELSSNRVIGFEALIRWTHNQHTILPHEFISIAEDSGLIVPLGEWLLDRACRQGSSWQRQGFSDIRIAVNVSSKQFERRNFVENVKRILERTGFDPHLLSLELVESVLVQRFDEAAARFNELRALGIRLALDDFGTGYSSLAYLNRLTFDAIKIDQSFTQALTGAANERTLVTAALSIATDFGMYAVAEGVETPEQANALETRGCQYAQGYLFAPPLTVTQATWVLGEGVLPRELNMTGSTEARFGSVA
jgi:diguanylate cyclase (GGDEF)-like protein